MLSVSIGPLALPVPPLVLGVAAVAAAWAANWLYARHHALRRAGAHTYASAESAPASGPGTPADCVWAALFIGLVVARLAHLLLHVEDYLASPLATLDIRDGGWHAPTGFTVGLAWLAWKGRRVPAWRRPLLLSALLGGLLWGTGTWWLGTRGGQPLPGLPFTALADGRVVRLSDVAAGRPAVVNLWASWCGPCREEMPLLAAVQARETHIAFVFVNQGEPPAAVRGYLSRHGLPLRDVLLDPGSSLLPAVGSRGLPTTLFYDAHGRLVDAHMGVLSKPALRVRLRQLATRP